MNKLQLSLLLLFTILSMTVQAGKPSWVKQRPSEKDYFIGIGVASKTEGGTDYMTLARNKALNEMASEIKVTISGNSILSQFENNNAIRQEYESKVQSNVMQTLEGYEVETWNGKTDYWVMVRMSKATYEMRRRLAIDKALKTAQLHFQFAQKALADNEPDAALSNYALAVEAIAPYPNEDLTVRDFDGEMNLGVSLQEGINDIMSNIIIRPETNPIEVKQGSSPIEASVFVAFVNADNQRIEASNLPIQFLMFNSKALPQTTTDMEGKATTSIVQIDWSNRSQTIIAQLDISVYFKNTGLDNPVVRAFFPKTFLPKCNINIELLRPKAWLEADETIFENESATMPFTNQVKSLLAEHFFTFTNNRDDAELVVKLSSQFVEGEEKKGQGYTAYIVLGSFDLSVTNLSNNSTIFSDSANSLKGMASGSYDKALKISRDNTVKYFENTIIPKMEETGN